MIIPCTNEYLITWWEEWQKSLNCFWFHRVSLCPSCSLPLTHSLPLSLLFLVFSLFWSSIWVTITSLNLLLNQRIKIMINTPDKNALKRIDVYVWRLLYLRSTYRLHPLVEMLTLFLPNLSKGFEKKDEKFPCSVLSATYIPCRVFPFFIRGKKYWPKTFYSWEPRGFTCFIIISI